MNQLPTTTLPREIQQNFDALMAGRGGTVPPGGLIPYAGASEPEGWLLCDGRAISRAQYARLFTVIGTTYGVGDGATTFNLPDLQGRTVVCKGTHAEVDALGDSDGLVVGSRKIKHRHTNGLSTGTESADHSHSFGVTNATGTAGYSTVLAVGSGAQSTKSTGGRSAAHSHAVSGTIGDGAGPLDSPAYIVLNYLIRA